MRESIFKIIDNAPLTQTVYKVKLQGDVSDITSSGQFVNIKLDGLYLLRPISVCDVEGDVLTITIFSGSAAAASTASISGVSVMEPTGHTLAHCPQ